jgi:hypothetical protein
LPVVSDFTINGLNKPEPEWTLYKYIGWYKNSIFRKKLLYEFLITLFQTRKSNSTRCQCFNLQESNVSISDKQFSVKKNVLLKSDGKVFIEAWFLQRKKNKEFYRFSK